MTYFSFNDIHFHPVDSDDLVYLRTHRNDFDTWKNLTNILPLTDLQQDNWHEKMSSDKNNLYLIVTTNSVPIGLIRIQDIDRINSSACIGCDVFKDYRNEGYGTKIMKGLVDYCFNYLNLHRLWLLVLNTNKAAIKIYKHAGFKLEGKQRKALYRNGKYHDYLMMSILKEEYK